MIIDRLLPKRMKISTDNTVIIGSGSQDELDTQEIDSFNEEINNNLDITTINVSGYVSKYGAEIIVENFLQSYHVQELRFDILSKVNHPSQWSLTKFKEDVEDRVEEHNFRQESLAQQSLLWLSVINLRRQRNKKEGIENLPMLPAELFKDILKPMLYGNSKRAILE